MAPLLPMEPLRLSRRMLDHPDLRHRDKPSRLLSRLRRAIQKGGLPLRGVPLVVQRGGGKSERAVAGDFPTAVVHHAELAQVQSARRGDQALSAIDQASLFDRA